MVTDHPECTLLTNPCNGHGVCIELAGSFTCDCDDGWNGPQCGNGNTIILYTLYYIYHNYLILKYAVKTFIICRLIRIVVTIGT